MVNPDINGRASPVILRIYELKSPAPFDGADFMSLYQQDRSVLGGELVAREEIVIEPGQNQAISKLLAPEARVLGVVAIFRDVERARWRSSVTLVLGKDNAVSVSVDDVRVTARPAAR
jgi:type VI secretion system protein VasD